MAKVICQILEANLVRNRRSGTEVVESTPREIGSCHVRVLEASQPVFRCLPRTSQSNDRKIISDCR